PFHLLRYGGGGLLDTDSVAAELRRVPCGSSPVPTGKPAPPLPVVPGAFPVA
ncbi:unnamed protein product, partial [Urochloa humidicola]